VEQIQYVRSRLKIARKNCNQLLLKLLINLAAIKRPLKIAGKIENF